MCHDNDISIAISSERFKSDNFIFGIWWGEIVKLSAIFSSMFSLSISSILYKCANRIYRSKYALNTAKRSRDQLLCGTSTIFDNYSEKTWVWRVQFDIFEWWWLRNKTHWDVFVWFRCPVKWTKYRYFTDRITRAPISMCESHYRQR